VVSRAEGDICEDEDEEEEEEEVMKAIVGSRGRAEG